MVGLLQISYVNGILPCPKLTIEDKIIIIKTMPLAPSNPLEKNKQCSTPVRNAVKLIIISNIFFQKCQKRVLEQEIIRENFLIKRLQKLLQNIFHMPR